MGAEPHRTLRGRYQLLAEIGRGGMGRVWRAHDSELNRVVAVKEILLGPGLDDHERDRMAARARREAQATAMGGHPNIVTVHDIVQDDGRPWIVMEFLSGRSLHALVRQEGPRGARVTAQWGLALLSALTTAHAQGITHRDVKPENVMVTDSGRVVLTDFGIATIADTSSVTQTAGVMGSPAYLAPERLAMSPATPASDLWSLGATLYCAATGNSPFRREGIPATLHAVTSEEPPDVLGRGPLAQAVRGLLVKDPAGRIDADRCRALLAAEGSAAATAFTAPSATTVSVPTRPGTAPTREVPPGPVPVRPGTPGPVPQAPAAFPTQTTVTTAPGPQRGGRLSWPMVVLTLGLASLVAVAALVVVLDPWDSDTSVAASGAGTGDPGSEEPSDPGAGEQEAGTGDGNEEGAPEETGAPQEGGADGDPVPGTTWTEDPEGFGLRTPEGWIRRVDGSSVFYESPADASYLQIDMAEHPTDDEYQHVLDQEQGVYDSGRLPGYERVRITDVTGDTGFHSAAEWEFTWQDEAGETRRVLTRNIAAAPGVYYTLAWASTDASWAAQDAQRTAAMESFVPA
ncbi:serine/threonine-protein kinase [Nocardiopsis alborubida]|uniref:non-specific serine/threonine protein kinase n=1 Tax=Nocardiopsis alborubida TaxID=146802 RepID=A0A7X6MB11_9ACTN|nr:serine/threonine-protein kinase [Nocardiopsis alborubida]NKY97947.1 serine/threonine protein kinase [Nocardiopsis alborubida]